MNPTLRRKCSAKLFGYSRMNLPIVMVRKYGAVGANDTPHSNDAFNHQLKLLKMEAIRMR